MLVPKATQQLVLLLSPFLGLWWMIETPSWSYHGALSMNHSSRRLPCLLGNILFMFSNI